VFDARLVRAAIVAFVLSRVVFFALAILGSQIAFLGKVYDGSVWETQIVLQSERVRPELQRVTMVGDAWWYRTIALNGYTTPQTRAFFPLFPLAVRTLAVTGDFTLDGMLLSNVAFACALLLLGPVALRGGLAIEDAERAVYYLAFFPTSYFLSLPVTESLFLALSLASVLAAYSGRWWLAGIFGGLAALARFPGVLLLLPLAFIFLDRRDRPWFRAAWLALIPAGTGLFLWYLGDPFAFVNAQSNWGREAGWFWEPLVGYVTHPQQAGEPWNLLALNFCVAALLLVAGLVLLAKRNWALGAYTLASVLVPLSSGSLQSISRYALVVFPLFFLLAMAGRKPFLDRIIFATSITLYGWLIAMMTLRVDFALA
jgi:hypothetical protein